MKSLSFILFILFFTLQLQGQEGWRQGEMEVKVQISSSADALKLSQLKLNGDFYPVEGYARMYLIPSELQMVRSLGLIAEITIKDLNRQYLGFWENRDEYHSYEEIIQEINLLSMAYSNICKKVSYGLSVEGRELVALKISDNVNSDENEPELMFDGGIHGDEIGGAENLVRFARFLCERYNVDPQITGLINSREIWLYIMVNPDGRVNMVRYNSNGVDLNRDWGYMWNGEGSSTGYYSQVETKALRNCLLDNQFVVHTSYHSGTVFLAYTWSYRPNPCPDQAHVHSLGMVYASHSGYTNLTVQQGYTGMYPIAGSSKDSYYGVMGSVGWSMEISTNKQPPASQIQYYYDLNEPAMIAMIEHAGYGVTGTVTDAVTGEAVAAVIFVDDLYPSYADPVVGDYHKYLVAGNYTVRAAANGYEAATQTVTVYANAASVANFTLQPAFNHAAYKVVACQIPGNNFDDEGKTFAAIGAPDGASYSLGKSGWIILDMGKTIFDGPGSEIRVHEGDDDPEYYTCFAAMSMDGPWTTLGNGYGSTTFNFSTANLSKARYIRILDSGSGAGSGDNAGFDLDAIEVLEQPPVIALSVDCLVDDPQGNGNNRIDPGENCSLVVSLLNLGGLTAQDAVLRMNFDSTWISIDNPVIHAGDLPYGETVNATFNLACQAGTPTGEIIMMVLNVSANDGSFLHSYPMHHTVGAIIEDWESNSFTTFNWSFTGDKPWIISFFDPQEGFFSAKSGVINDNQVSGLEVTMDVTGYDDISFYRKVSSEAGGDFLRFYIDGVMMDQWSGTLAWDKVSYNVTPGVHTFRWKYSKNWGISQGIDGAWIDYIQFPSCNLSGELHALANALPDEFCLQGQSQLGVYLSGGDGSYGFLWAPDSSLNHPGIQFPVASPAETTVYQVEVTDGKQTAASAVKITIYPIPDTPVVVQQGDSLVSSASEGNQWYDSGGMIEGAMSPVYYPDHEDYYHVIVTSAAGCISSPSDPVYFLFTAIDEKQEGPGLVIYPNPTNSDITIHVSKGISSDYQFLIYDLSGRAVSGGHVADGAPKQVRLSRLQKGMYFFILKDHSGSVVYMRKIINLGA